MHFRLFLLNQKSVIPFRSLILSLLNNSQSVSPNHKKFPNWTVWRSFVIFLIFVVFKKPEFGSYIKSDPRSKSEGEARMAWGERFSSLLDVGQVRVGALEIKDTGLPLRRLTVRKTSVEKIRTRTTNAVFY